MTRRKPSFSAVGVRHGEVQPLKGGHWSWYFTAPSAERHAFPRKKVGDSREMPFSEACKAIQDWNQKLDLWRLGRGADATGRIEGTLTWLVALYQKSTAYRGLRFRTKRDYERHHDWLTHLYGTTALRKWDRLAASKFIDTLDQDACGRVTRQGHYQLQVMKIIWAWGRAQGHITVENPFELRRIRHAPRAEKALWRQPDIDDFLASDATEPAKRAIILGWVTSQRPQDVVLMSPAHLKDGTIIMRQQKVGRLVGVEIELYRDEIESWRDGLKTFVRGERGQPLSVGYVSHAITTYAPRPGLTFKQLRASAAVRWWEDGVPQEWIMDRTGHTNLQTLIGHYVPVGHRGNEPISR